MKSNIDRIQGYIFVPCDDTLRYCEKDKYFSQNYKDAKSRIGKLGCPYCKEKGSEFEDDAKVIFQTYKEIEVFLPNRYIDEGTENRYYEEARLYTVCLCTAEIYCPNCGEIVKVFSHDRYIDQMQVIIDYLKLRKIEIPMPRPRDCVSAFSISNGIMNFRELVTCFIIDEDSDEYQEECINFEDEEEDGYREFTLETDVKLPDVPSYVLRQPSFLNTRKSTYVEKIEY